MLTDDELKKMHSKLVAVVASVCADCDKPHIEKSEINLDDPEACKCHCGKVDGICEALRGIKVKPN